MTITVYTQEEFDKSYNDGNRSFIVSGFTVRLLGNSRAVLLGNSHAVLRENSHAELLGNSHAVLLGNSRAVLRGNSHAELWGNSRAVLLGNSRAVLRENSHAELWENSHAVLLGNSRAVLRGNSHAELRGNSRAVLWGNSRAVLLGNSHAVLFDYGIGFIKGGSAKKVSPHSSAIKINYPNNIRDWCAMKGIKISKAGYIRLWKVVNENGFDFYTGQIQYKAPQVGCPDWEENYNGECGYALHLADCPSSARNFVVKEKLKTARLFEEKVHIDDCMVFGGLPNYPEKIRVKECSFVKEYPIDYNPSF